MEKVQLKSNNSVSYPGSGEHYFVYWVNENRERELAGIAHHTPFSKLGEYKFKINWLPNQLFYLKQVGCENNRIEYRVYSIMQAGTQKVPSAKPTGGKGVSVRVPVDEIIIDTRAFRDSLVIDLKSSNQSENSFNEMRNAA